MPILDDLSARHQRLKERIHSFRMPLSKRGQVAMNMIYFAIPVVGGYCLMQWAHGRAQVNLRGAGVLPEFGEARTRSTTEVQNNALQNRLDKVKKELEVEAGGGRLGR